MTRKVNRFADSSGVIHSSSDNVWFIFNTVSGEPWINEELIASNALVRQWNCKYLQWIEFVSEQNL